MCVCVGGGGSGPVAQPGGVKGVKFHPLVTQLGRTPPVIGGRQPPGGDSGFACYPADDVHQARITWGVGTEDDARRRGQRRDRLFSVFFFYFAHFDFLFLSLGGFDFMFLTLCI